MKKIRNRARPDRLETDLRNKRRSIGRRIYFIIVFIIFLIGLNFFIGDRYFVKAPAVVLREEIQIEAPYYMAIVKVYKRPGEAVQFGEPIFDAVVLNPIGSQAWVNPPLMQDWRTRIFAGEPPEEEQIFTDQWIKDTVKKGALLNINQSSFAGQSQYFSPINGHMNDIPIKIGQVFIPGEEIASIFHGKMYAWLYLPANYRLENHIGDQYKLKFGSETAKAVVSEILPVSASLPVEFHNSIRAIGRNTILRLEVEESANFPLNHAVEASKFNTILDRFYAAF